MSSGTELEGEISQGTCKANAVTGCVSSSSLQSCLRGGGVKPQYLQEAEGAWGKRLRDRQHIGESLSRHIHALYYPVLISWKALLVAEATKRMTIVKKIKKTKKNDILPKSKVVYIGPWDSHVGLQWSGFLWVLLMPQWRLLNTLQYYNFCPGFGDLTACSRQCTDFFLFVSSFQDLFMELCRSFFIKWLVLRIAAWGFKNSWPKL